MLKRNLALVGLAPHRLQLLAVRGNDLLGALLRSRSPRSLHFQRLIRLPALHQHRLLGLETLKLQPFVRLCHRVRRSRQVGRERRHLLLSRQPPRLIVLKLVLKLVPAGGKSRNLLLGGRATSRLISNRIVELVHELVLALLTHKALLAQLIRVQRRHLGHPRLGLLLGVLHRLLHLLRQLVESCSLLLSRLLLPMQLLQLVLGLREALLESACPLLRCLAPLPRLRELRARICPDLLKVNLVQLQLLLGRGVSAVRLSELAFKVRRLRALRLLELCCLALEVLCGSGHSRLIGRHLDIRLVGLHLESHHAIACRAVGRLQLKELLVRRCRLLTRVCLRLLKLRSILRAHVKDRVLMVPLQRRYLLLGLRLGPAECRLRLELSSLELQLRLSHLFSGHRCRAVRHCLELLIRVRALMLDGFKQHLPLLLHLRRE